MDKATIKVIDFILQSGKTSDSALTRQVWAYRKLDKPGREKVLKEALEFLGIEEIENKINLS